MSADPGGGRNGLFSWIRFNPDPGAALSISPEMLQTVAKLSNAASLPTCHQTGYVLSCTAIKRTPGTLAVILMSGSVVLDTVVCVYIAIVLFSLKSGPKFKASQNQEKQHILTLVNPEV